MDPRDDDESILQLLDASIREMTADAEASAAGGGARLALKQKLSVAARLTVLEKDVERLSHQMLLVNLARMSEWREAVRRSKVTREQINEIERTIRIMGNLTTRKKGSG